MSYSFIINPRSGTIKNKLFLKKLISSNISETHEINYTEYPGHAIKLTLAAIEKGFTNVVSVGGDGTLNEIASCLVGKDINLGVIPMGSGNGFARSLNIPLIPNEAIKNLSTGVIKHIDVGRANDKYFFTVAGVGFEAVVAEAFQQNKRRGPVPYFYLSFKAFKRYNYPQFNLKSKHWEKSVNPLTIALANAPQYGSGAFISPKADMTDGLLNICIVEKINYKEIYKYIHMLFKKRIDQLPAYNSFTTNELSISADGLIYFHTDGEPNVCENTILFKTIPKGLRVIINKD